MNTTSLHFAYALCLWCVDTSTSSRLIIVLVLVVVVLVVGSRVSFCDLVKQTISNYPTGYWFTLFFLIRDLKKSATKML